MTRKERIERIKEVKLIQKRALILLTLTIICCFIYDDIFFNILATVSSVSSLAIFFIYGIININENRKL